MTQSMALTSSFPDASRVLSNLIDTLEADMLLINKASHEAYQSLHNKLVTTWEEWPAKKENFRLAVNNLPSELRKRDFVNTAVHELEHFEVQAKAYFNHLAEVAFESYKTSLNAKTEAFQQQRARMHEQTRRIALQLAELQAHPLTQKFIRGETILASRSKIQWGRKLGHMCCGLSFLYVFAFSGWSTPLKWALTGGFAIWSLSLETARHLNPRVNAWVCKAFRPVMREREKNKINSAIFFMVAMIFVYWIFPRDVAVLTMLFISLGDPVAGIVGVYFGKHKISQHASAEGVLACFVLCTTLAAISATWFFNQYHVSAAHLPFFALTCGAVGAVAESSFKMFDDNLTMPLVSAPLIWLVLHLL